MQSFAAANMCAAMTHSSQGTKSLQPKINLYIIIPNDVPNIKQNNYVDTYINIYMYIYIYIYTYLYTIGIRLIYY